MILPSFLEYSEFGLRTKLQKITANIDKFREITGQNKQKTILETKIENKKNQATELSTKNSNLVQIFDLKSEDILYFHLDFVFTEFAKDRKVMQSLGLRTVFNLFLEFFEDAKLQLSVHLMGEKLDWKLAFEFWQEFTVPQNWQIDLFVKPKMTNLFTFNKNNLQTFCWFDKDSWGEFLETGSLQSQNLEKIEDVEIQITKETKNKILLMTVFAGISGQKLEKQIQKLALEIVSQSPQTDFILDGGWKIQDLETAKKLNLDSVDLVSYSDFWQEFGKRIKNI